MGDPGLFTLPCRLEDSKPFDTLADLGSCVNIIPLYLFKKLNIGLLEETDHIFGLADETRSYPVGIVKDVEVHIGKLKLLNDLYVLDMKKDPETPLLVGRGFLATANAVIDCRIAKITVGEEITRYVDTASRSYCEAVTSIPVAMVKKFVTGYNIPDGSQTPGPAFRLLKGTRSNYAELVYDFEECYKALSEKLDWDNPEGDDYPFDLTKPLPLVMNGNHQMVPVDYFFNNDLKYLQGGILTLTYTTSLTKTKTAQYDLPGIEDMHGYGYLREIEVRRADNDLYTFKEGDFPRLRINDIEDMLLLIVQNRLTNLSGNDVSDFAIALRMFTRSMVIQKRVEKSLNWVVERLKRRSTSPSQKLPNLASGKETHTLHIKTLKESFMLTTKGETG
ncbi:retrovirus-related pol polyprotein from transposon TNT 1-94 [Tanacetum coccineum]